MRAGDRRNLGVHACRLNGEIGAFGHKIANLAKKSLVGRRIMWLSALRAMPIVDLGLNFGPLNQKRPVLRPQIIHDPGETRPEIRSRDLCARQRLCFDESGKFSGDG